MNRREALRLAVLGTVGAVVAACTEESKPKSSATLSRTGGAPSAGSPATTGARPSRPAGATPAPVALGPAREVLHGSRTGSAVALTFHGAGDPAYARSILTHAHDAGAVLTILAVGNWLRDNPAMAHLVLDQGHELGNHTFNHRPMRQLSASTAYDEIARCRDELMKLTGSPGVWFRPSGTPRATGTILRAAGKAGYRLSVGYDVDPRDYQDPGSSAIRSRVKSAVRAGSVVSLHLGHSGTVQAMPGILDDLKAAGLTPVGLSRLPGL